MQVIIPMSGLGSRFVKAGYLPPKPLIKIHGMPIIEHVTNMFPEEEKLVFICREEHLANTDMKSALHNVAPKANIVEIEGHKLGPVYAVTKAFDHINDEEPVVVSYCDYYMDWDYSDFKKTMLEGNYDGCVPCYKGFHPHLLHEKNVYAGCQTDANGMLTEIKEKFSFEIDKTKGKHSPGVYYFKSGALMKKYFQKALDISLKLNGEYYVSLVYNLLLADGLKVNVYDKIDYFCQWGTPEDFEEYLYWSEIFNKN